jgi:hypothetical protein
MKFKLFLLAALAFAVGCTKVGPQGPPGQTGAVGLTGSTGATGAAGNADTKIIFDSIAASSWTAGTSGYYYTFASFAPLADGDSDIVSVAISTSLSLTNISAAQWFPLTVSNFLAAGDQFSFSYNTYNLTVYYTYTSAPVKPWLYFKIVISPPAEIQRKPGIGAGQSSKN